jgi:hypothetical protein
MRYFQPTPDTRFYAGVDLDARSLFLVVLDHTGQWLQENWPFADSSIQIA